MRVIRRLALDRRTLLRGGAASLALPWLDAMAPALSSPPKPPRRALFVFSPNGVHVANWRPDGEGGAARFGATLEPLEPLRERVTAFSGLTIDGGRSHGDGPGDHARSAASFLTCAHPRKTGGDDIRAGVSVDQVLAQHFAGRKATPFASLELGMERGRSAGVCDSGYSCAYSNNVSWRAPDRPQAKQTDPREVFARLFGDPEAQADRQQEQRRAARSRSVLDLVRADAKSLQRQLGGGDRKKLDQYLESVRELEQRLEQADRPASEVPVPERLLDDQLRFPQRLELMYEMIRLAFATDRTRVVSFMLGNGGSNRSYRHLGVPEGHHTLSHHGKNEDKLASIGKIDRFHVERFAAFLQGLAAERDGERDLLENCFVVYGSGIGDGNRHNHHDLPVLLCGGGGGTLGRSRGHVVVPRETPMAGLYLSVLRGMGCPADAFADSDGPLALA